MHEPTNSTTNRSVLATLRSMVPDCEIGFQHTLRIVERQADELLRQYGNAGGPTPDDIVTRFPRVKVILRTDLPTSGASRWNGSQWVIFVRSTDSPARRRFTAVHELAHIIHHGYGDRLFAGRPWLSETERRADAARQRERAADHFAGCVLMPRAAIFAAWSEGPRTPEAIAERFAVSTAAAKVRLEQLELIRPRWMCTRGARTYDDQPAPTADTRHRMSALGLRRPRRTHLTARRFA